MWAQSEENVKYLASLQLVVRPTLSCVLVLLAHRSEPYCQGYTGGPLSQVTGEKLVAAGVPLYSVYGGTEYGSHAKVFNVDYTQGPDPYVKSKEDWEYVSFPDSIKSRWVPQGDGTYELQFLVSQIYGQIILLSNDHSR